MTEETTIVDETIATEEEIQETEQVAEQVKEETEQEKYSKRVQKRIDKLEWEKNEERRRAYALEKEIQELKDVKAEKQQLTGKPHAEDFAAGVYDPEYLEALTDYKSQLAIDKYKESVTIGEKAKAIAKMQEVVKEKYSDYEEVAEEFLSNPLSTVDAFNDILMDTDNPVEIAYFLGKNPQELEKIADMTITQATRYIGRLEAKLENESPTLEPTKKQVSNAPKPISPVSGAKTQAGRKHPKDMSTEEYAVFMKNGYKYI